jgi:PTS system cellobiose-specific IIB component
MKRFIKPSSRAKTVSSAHKFALHRPVSPAVTVFSLKPKPVSLFCDALHTITAKRLSCLSARDKDDASGNIRAINYEEYRFMLRRWNVHQHAGSTYAGCCAQKGVEVSIKAVPVAEFKDNLAAADIILLGPQVKYEQAKLQALADPFGKKVAVIDMMDYGMMKGDAVLDKALKLME